MNLFPDFKCAGFNIEEYNKRFHNANVIIHAKSKSVDFPEHWGGLSVKTVLTGSENYKTKERLYSVDPNNYLLFNEGRYYSSWIDSTTEVESFTLNFSPDFEKRAIRSLITSPKDQLDNPFTAELDFRFTERLYRHDEQVTPVVREIYALSGNVAKNESLIDTLFFSLLEKLVNQQLEAQQQINNLQKLKSSTRRELFERLSRAKDFINASYPFNLTLAQIADVACLNQYYFLKQFKLAFHLTPHQYLTKRRLVVAEQLLKKSDQSVSSVCHEIGFNDVASFTKLFKRTFGYSPMQYRKICC